MILKKLSITIDNFRGMC